MRKTKPGHGELLKALTKLPGCTNLHFRIAATYLAHATPPKRMKVFPSADKVAQLAKCHVRSVHRTKQWLEAAGAVIVYPGVGRGNATVLNFEPLAQQVIGGSSVTLVRGEAEQGAASKRDTTVTNSTQESVTVEPVEEKECMTAEPENTDSVTSHQGPCKDYSLRGRIENESSAHAGSVAQGAVDRLHERVKERGCKEKRQPPFGEIVDDAIPAMKQRLIVPSDWLSLSSWWQSEYGTHPSVKQLKELERQLNDRARR